MSINIKYWFLPIEKKQKQEYAKDVQKIIKRVKQVIHKETDSPFIVDYKIPKKICFEQKSFISIDIFDLNNNEISDMKDKIINTVVSDKNFAFSNKKA